MKELTKERMGEIRSLYEGMDRIYYQKEVNDLLEHINFLESIINDMGCDGITEAYKRGREKGLQEAMCLLDDWANHTGNEIKKIYGTDPVQSLYKMMEMLKEGKIRRK